MSIKGRNVIGNGGISIHIDEWTNSVIEVSTGKTLKTGFKLMTATDVKEIVPKEWFFKKWKTEIALPDRQVYKIYTDDAKKILLGLISLSVVKGFVLVYKNGVIAFDAKSDLIGYYKRKPGASVLFGQRMIINEIAADKLIKFYYP